jgi:hypothetical protein
MLHFYLQQPGIIKMFFLCNIPGKVPLFFLYKQDIMQVNCMQNITKYYILLRNVASVLNTHLLCSCKHLSYFGSFNPASRDPGGRSPKIYNVFKRFFIPNEKTLNGSLLTILALSSCPNPLPWDYETFFFCKGLPAHSWVYNYILCIGPRDA